jgi:DNA topoisomerase IA
LVFDGFTRVRGANKSDDDILLPAVKVGEVLKLKNLIRVSILPSHLHALLKRLW